MCVTAKRGDSDRAMYTEPLQTTRQGMSRMDANLTNLRTGIDQKRYSDVNTLDWEIAPFLHRILASGWMLKPIYKLDWS